MVRYLVAGAMERCQRELAPFPWQERPRAGHCKSRNDHPQIIALVMWGSLVRVSWGMNALRSKMIRTGPGREEVLAKNELPGQKQPITPGPGCGRGWRPLHPGPTERSSGASRSWFHKGGGNHNDSISSMMLLCKGARVLMTLAACPVLCFCCSRTRLLTLLLMVGAHAGKCCFQPPCCNPWLACFSYPKLLILLLKVGAHAEQHCS